MHGLYKRVIPYTNKKNITIDLLKRDNTLQALRYLMDDEKDERYIGIIGNLFGDISNDPSLHKLLSGWYIGNLLQNHLRTDNVDDNIGISIFSIHPDFEDIQVRGLW